MTSTLSLRSHRATGLMMISLGVLLALASGQGCPASGPEMPPTGGSDPSPPPGLGQVTSFSNGGVTLDTQTTRSSDLATTVVSQGSQDYLRMEVNAQGVRLLFPREGNVEDFLPFETARTGLPSEFATNRLAAYIVGQLYFGPGSDVSADNSGCDWFPDTNCTLRCCADHDRCFAAHSCGASSWIPGFGSEACKNCNRLARSCILDACWSGSEGDATTDVCFDASCGMSYTCPNNPFDCYACDSPCAASPATCGNGTCEVGETPENCVNDCALGLGVNICCMENNNCPSETPTNCPGGCCCCGYGEVCGPGYLCTRAGGGDSSSTIPGGPEEKRAATPQPCEAGDGN